MTNSGLLSDIIVPAPAGSPQPWQNPQGARHPARRTFVAGPLTLR